MFRKSKTRFLALIFSLTLTLGSSVYAQELTPEAEPVVAADVNGGTAEEMTEQVKTEETVEPTDPTDPTDLTEPTDPTDPTDPTEPTEPTDPTEPSAPTEPGWFKGAYYVENASGQLVPATGVTLIDGKYHYLNEDGTINKSINGLTYVKNKKYYYFTEGVGGRPTENGLLKVDDHWYFFATNGNTYTGKRGVDGIYYYFGKNGQGCRPDNAASNGITLIDGVYYKFTTNGKAYTKTGLMSYDGHYYFFGTSGKACTTYKKVDDIYYQFDSTGMGKGGWLQLVSNKCYTAANGKSCAGWKKISGYYYFFSKDKRLMQKNKIVEGYKLDEEGRNKTKVYIADTVKKYTNSSMTTDQKLSALWSFMMSPSYRYVANSQHLFASWEWPKGWTDDYALNYFLKKGSNCYGYAATYAYLVKEATGLPVRVYHGTTSAAGGGTTPHGWCLIKINGVWYAFDPDLYKYTARSSLYYYTSYSVTRRSIHFELGYDTL